MSESKPIVSWPDTTHAGERNMTENRKAGRRPSMFEVAKMAGVSHQTVSRVINDSPDVSPTTRERVREAIRTLDYHPSNSARALASRRSHTIGLIAGGLRLFGPISTITAIEGVARAHSLFMSVSLLSEPDFTPSEFRAMCDSFDEQNVDAFLFLTPTDEMFAAACRVAVSRPRVIVTSTHGGLSMSAAGRMMHVENRRRTALVGIDQWGAMADVMALIGRYGHRSALYLAGPSNWRDAATRMVAWRKLAAEHSVASRVVQCSSWDASEAYARMNHVLDRFGYSGSTKPTVVVTANDAQAVGVIRALHEHRIRIPQDISVVGFDDISGADELYPPLTTVRPRFHELGTAAMREALRLLGEGEETVYAASAHGVGLIPAELVQRASLGPVPIA